MAVETEGCGQYLQNELCGFTLGPANNEPCYLMRRRVGWLSTDGKIFIRFAKLPNVLKWLSRLNTCGDKVIERKFCNQQDKTWVWEATAYRTFRTFEGFVTASPPYVITHALGADGLVMVEERRDRSLGRQRFYKDHTVILEMRHQHFDTFMENQVAEKTHSWGPNGALLPWTNSSKEWRSCLNENGVGIVCYFGELWLGSYNWSAKSGADYGEMYFDIIFRPRQISRSDLMLYLFKQSCGRPCGEKETVLNYPCIDGSDYQNEAIPEAENVKDTDQITVPSGKKMTGKDYKSKLEDRSDYVEPCIKTCKASGTVSSLYFSIPTYEEENRSIITERKEIRNAYMNMLLSFSFLKRDTKLYQEQVALLITQLKLLENALNTAKTVSELFKNVKDWAKQGYENIAPALKPQFMVAQCYTLLHAYYRRHLHWNRYDITDQNFWDPENLNISFTVPCHKLETLIDWGKIEFEDLPSLLPLLQTPDVDDMPSFEKPEPAAPQNTPDVVPDSEPDEPNETNQASQPVGEPMEESSNCDQNTNDGN